MNKILLALIILGAGAGGFLTARQSTTQLQQKANATREAWVVQTQLLAVAQSDQAGLREHIRKLKHALAQSSAVEDKGLWSALQTNRAGQLTPELRAGLLEELGFNWQSSEDYVVVSKETVRDIQITATKDGKLTDIAATVLAMTPAERAEVEGSIQRLRTDFADWASSHVERSEPKGEVVAQYTLPSAMSLSNNFAAGVFQAVGKERAQLIVWSAWDRLRRVIGYDWDPWTLIVKRHGVGDEQRLEFETSSPILTNGPYSLSDHAVPRAFLPIFPNGWADVAKREGFELPKESQEK